MSLLLKNCRIFDPQSEHHEKKRDIFIDKGRIQKIGTNLSDQNEREMNGFWVTPGWTDLNANFNDPGFEHKEDLLSGSDSATSGGFTDVLLLPNTHPCIDSKSDVEYILNKASSSVDLHVMGALSEGTKGENFTEILDLQSAGARVFSDGMSPIWNTELLAKALQYIQKFNGVIFSRPRDPHLGRNSQMHEGQSSTMLGLRGEPSISEKIQIGLQLEILKYAGGRLHFSLISTADGLKLIKQAKKEGLDVTCDVGIHHLRFVDRDVSGFDTRFKIDPPFRTGIDRKALLKGIKENVVDAIVSGHQPQDRESKYLEFDLAEPGVIGQQTVFSTLMSLQEELSFELAVEKLTKSPRNILGLEPISISEGEISKLAFFDPKEEWILDSSTNQSKSSNSPYWKKNLVGRCVGTLNGSKTTFRK